MRGHAGGSASSLTEASGARPRVPLSVALAAVLACAAPEPAAQGSLTPPERHLVLNWLTCIDCRVELDSMRTLAARKPAVVDTLVRALEGGPRGDSVPDSVFALAFVRDSSYRVLRGRAPVGVDRVAYIAREQERFAAGYRTRAAAGLGWLHSPTASKGLTDALALPGLSAYVRQAIVYARDSMPP